MNPTKKEEQTYYLLRDRKDLPACNFQLQLSVCKFA
jgi:hypothetical protein